MLSWPNFSCYSVVTGVIVANLNQENCLWAPRLKPGLHYMCLHYTATLNFPVLLTKAMNSMPNVTYNS
jgi:hypothetical protein